MNAQEKQQGLNEVVVRKVEKMVTARQENVRAVIGRLHREQELLRDYVVPIGTERHRFDPNARRIVPGRGNGYAEHSAGSVQPARTCDRTTGRPHGHSVALPARDGCRGAVAACAGGRHAEPALHTYAPSPGTAPDGSGAQVRGVLSDSYRRIDSQSTLIAFLEEAKRQGAVICDAYMSDTKVWAETILPAPLTIPTAKNGHVVIFMGARFSTSDYGDGALDMRAFLLNGVCLNGMVRESVWKQIHLGAKLPGNLRLSDRTYELDTQATVSAVRDLARAALQPRDDPQKGGRNSAGQRNGRGFHGGAPTAGEEQPAAEKRERAGGATADAEPARGRTSGRSHAVEADAGADGFRRDTEPTRSREMQELSGELFKKIA